MKGQENRSDAPLQPVAEVISGWHSRSVWIASLLLAAAGQVGPDTSRQAGLMDTIEKRVSLPVGAGSLNTYSRFYTRADTGQIIGVYIRGSYAGLGIGKRRWVRSFDDLPSIMDGGCYVVNVVYVPGKMKMPSARCNGYA